MIAYHGSTDVGSVRTNNEDVFLINAAGRYCLVADGMGGAAAGEVASRIFTEAAQAVFDGHDGQSDADTISRVKATFKLANETIQQHVRRNPHDQGMGCTAELLAFSREHFIIGHVGDSRTYRLKNMVLKQLTKDHSLVQEQVDQGRMAPQEARRHPMRNVILRAVGVQPDLVPDVLKGKPSPGDLFLLCSDGLSDMVEESLLQATMNGEGTLAEKSTALIELANLAGGKDNVTVVLCAVG